MPLSKKYGDYFTGFDAALTFEFYENVRDGLPTANFPETSHMVSGLLEIADQIDIFVFDAYGVLNVGGTPIVGATQCVAALRAMGKTVFVLTNSATFPATRNFDKFQHLGFDFADNEIISSRVAARQFVAKQPKMVWGVMGKSDSEPQDFGVETIMLGDDPAAYASADGFILLSTWEWNSARQLLLDAAIAERPRPVVVANPDVIAPMEQRFSTEPGFVGHRLARRFGIDIAFHGKPFPSVFEIIEGKLKDDQDLARVAMIGDTLHTDVLGGASRGWSTVLVSDHGLFRGQDARSYIAKSGIVPTYIVPSI